MTLFAFGVQAERNGEIRMIDGERKAYLASQSTWVAP